MTDYFKDKVVAIKPSKDKENNQEFCKECSFPLLLSIKKGKRPWELCFNTECPDNIRRREEWEARQDKVEGNQDKPSDI